MEATASSSDEIVMIKHQIHTAIPALCHLLAFTTNSEVIEFFETDLLYW
jgi:hypothetical protein